MSNTYLNPASISPIILKTAEGKTLDITSVVKKIEVYESIFSNFLTATLSILDTPETRLIQRGLKTALDEIFFSFAGKRIDGSSEKTININLMVYKTQTENADTNQTGQTIVIHLAPRHFFKNMTLDVSRHYSGKITDNVKKLATDLQITIDDIEASSDEMIGNYNYKSPLELINKFATICRPDRNKNDVNYLFYQKIDSFHFRSVGSLLEKKPTVGTNSSNGFTLEMPFKLPLKKLKNNVLSYDISRQSPIENAKKGMYTSSVLTFDMTLKRYVETTYSLKNEFSKQTHLTTNPIIDPNKCQNFSELLQNSFLTRYTQKGRFTMLCEDPPESQDKVGGPDDWLLKRISLIQQLNQLNLVFSIPGTSENISAGDVFYFGRPIQQQLSNDKPEKDILHNGKFLATEVKHTLSYNLNTVIAEYKTTIKGTKDSIGEE